MGYVVICHGNGKYDGWYTAKPGSQHSYVKNLQDARVYPTRDAANADKCGNETVHALSDLLRPC